jgi:hypothetical protein
MIMTVSGLFKRTICIKTPEGTMPLLAKFKRRKLQLPRTPEEKEHAQTQEFLDMCAPAAIRFESDYYICGSSYRSVWAIREYPPETNEQALLRHLGEKSGVTLRIYARHVSQKEEKHLLSNSTNKNRMNRDTPDIQQAVIAESNLKDLANLTVVMRKTREPFLYCAVFIELSAMSLQELKELQDDVFPELNRAKICVDQLFIRQRDGFQSAQPGGYNAFKRQYERVLPASSVANLYPFNYSGKVDPNGFYLGHDKFGSNIIVDFQRRTEDKTNGNVVRPDRVQ